MSVPFRFDTVLRVREAERDRCRQALAFEQQREASLVADRDRLSEERAAALEELRTARQKDGLSAEQQLTRHLYAEDLATRITGIKAALNEILQAIVQRRSELLEADTAVKALEKLAGRHTENQLRLDQANSERDREDTWRSGRVA